MTMRCGENDAFEPVEISTYTKTSNKTDLPNYDELVGWPAFRADTFWILVGPLLGRCTHSLSERTSVALAKRVPGHDVECVVGPWIYSDLQAWKQMQQIQIII